MIAPASVNLLPTGRPTVEGTHCPCGNQRRSSRRCCRACARYFWRRNGELRPPVVPMPPTCARVRSVLSSEVCPAITADTVAMAVSVRRWLELRRALSVPGVNGEIRIEGE